MLLGLGVVLTAVAVGGAFWVVPAKLIMAALLYLTAIFIFQRRVKELFYLYLLAVFYFPPTIGIDTPFILLNVDRMVLAVLLGSWGVAVFRGSVRWVRSPIDGSIFFYLIAVLASIAANYGYISHQGLTTSAFMKVFVLAGERMLLVYVLLSVLKDKRELKSMLVFIAFNLAVVAGYGVIESKTHYNIFTQFTTVDREGVNLTALSEALRAGLYRAKSTQMLPHIFGTELVMFFALLLHTILNSRWLGKMSAMLAAALFAGGIAVTYTRGVYLVLLLAVGLALLYLRSPIKRIALLLMLTAALFAASTQKPVQEFYKTYLSHLLVSRQMTQDREHSIQGRLSDYEYTAKRLKERPVFGRGLGTHIAGLAEMPFLDNAYLYVLIETGLVGMTAFLWLLFNLVVRLGWRIRSRLDADEDADRMRYVHIGIVVFYFQCLTYDAFTFGGASKLFWVIVGLLVAYLKLSEPQRRETTDAQT